MKKFLLCCLVAASTALANPATRADTAAFATTGGTLGNGQGLTLGYAFTLTNSVRVTALGFYDSGGDGLSGATPVTIWNNAGVSQASATIPAGTGTLVGGYVYLTLASPVTLAAGTYTIGSYVTNASDDSLIGVSTITPASGISYAGTRGTSGNAYPSGNDFGGTNSYFGPNFQFNAVPEPSTWAAVLGGAGLLGLTLRRRRAHLA